GGGGEIGFGDRPPSTPRNFESSPSSAYPYEGRDPGRRALSPRTRKGPRTTRTGESGSKRVWRADSGLGAAPDRGRGSSECAGKSGEGRWPASGPPRRRVAWLYGTH